MLILTEAEFRESAESSLRLVFLNDDPFNQRFAPDVPARRIIYEYFYRIEPPLLDAVVAAASRVGDTGCYLSNLWRNKEQPEHPNHWYIHFSEISAYIAADGKVFNNALTSENVLYSPQGKWGVMMSHEHHGLLAGTHEFMEEICRLIPDLDRQVYGFLDYWKYWYSQGNSADVTWLPGLLTQIYGRETAKTMLREAGLKSIWRKYSSELLFT
ncbi:hypothetical protein [Coleofasciculus sp. FACHB-129]|uniref:hypothetical protein n=1 Tax=Cyanophyceae TaxID=3028117 RepID=UPI001689ED5C|nr:hypothetical protein [Coleofasciculus sp. FACHB-129]MBD1894036.1 hypothetical protein [Coleofasciculus sp. FACHB-129]